MAERFFLDSNIIMYAIGGPHPLKRPSTALLERVQSGQLTVVTNTEVLQEILYRYSSCGKMALALEATQLTTEIVDEIFPVTADDLQLTMELLRHAPKVSVRDAIHCATMIHHRIRSILSANRHFDRFDRIRRIDPADFSA